MSIIEKAANRFEQNKGAITPPMIKPESPSEQSSKIINEHNTRNSDKKTITQVEINLAKLHQLGMITPDQGKTLAAQEFRGIKRSLIQKAFINGAGAIHHGNLIMVTSALPREGKTFCAINLAMSIATEMDHTVLLIDADVARPSSIRTLGLKSAVGLMDILLDEQLNLAEVMINTNVDTLRILPAGTSHRHATELLASQAMSSLLNEIANRYPDRIVIFDSPPLLPTTGAPCFSKSDGSDCHGGRAKWPPNMLSKRRRSLGIQRKPCTLA